MLLLTACRTTADEPAAPSVLSEAVSGGRIIATIGCYDSETTKENYYQGCVIETAEKDTLLSFYFDQGLVAVDYGVRMTSVAIPYAFTYRVILANDERYILFEMPVQDGLRPDFPRSLSSLKQVEISQSNTPHSEKM